MPKRSKIIFNKKKRGFFSLLLVETFTLCIFIINIQQKRHSAAKLVTFNKQIKMCVFLTLIAEVSKKKKKNNNLSRLLNLRITGLLNYPLKAHSIITMTEREKKSGEVK